MEWSGWRGCTGSYCAKLRHEFAESGYQRLDAGLEALVYIFDARSETLVGGAGLLCESLDDLSEPSISLAGFLGKFRPPEVTRILEPPRNQTQAPPASQP